MFGAMAKQSGGGHDRVGARQKIFEHFIGRLHARAGARLARGSRPPSNEVQSRP